MAAKIPEKLKNADVQRFATRAAQLHNFKPIISYWCEYYILQQILNRGLHTADEECTTYATTLMDKLEQEKNESATNDAIVDDVAAKAYVENFALDTFERADKAQREDRVNRQTADTFQAAATFLDTLGIWGSLDAEQSAKSKFAKFHALRIARALKAGEDPNATNPKVERLPVPGEDELDAEMKDLEAKVAGGQERRGSSYLPPTVESAPESKQPSRPESTAPGIPFDPPQIPKTEPGDQPMASPGQGDVSPIESNERHNSIGGGYFPSVPGEPHTDTADAPAPSAETPLEPDFSEQPSAPSPTEFYQASHAPQAPTPSFAPIRPDRPPPEQMTAQPPAQPSPQPSPAFQPPPGSFPAPQIGFAQPTPPAHAPPIGGYKSDDESTMAAQKHAKWAISALNFEDVPTAVKELRLALQSLGAN
ncbi:DUF605-domain-containing protein [Polychaeton citri CBS 116435]|uniref:DUF605-domain-containing protein n=1 Tax=Polychaeton citri CBS 116435 TaxID=1314669 RepID=A0A9P4UP96_9PEZI|nr:DUF605-domain-containing protein [Polychaeton citri CBS 116435]